MSCASAARQQPAFMALGQSLRPKRALAPLRALADRYDESNDDDGNHIEDDQLPFRQRAPHPYYQVDDGHHYAEDSDELQSQLDKISWLPSMLSTSRERSSHSRKENMHGDAYDSLDRISPKDIEIMPVLPLHMVKRQENDFSDFSYASGVWVEGSDNDIFSSPAYLPHTSNHVLAIAEPRYKQMYDDLLQLGEYWGQKRNDALSDARRQGIDLMYEEDLPNPEEKRRFIGTMMHPNEEGVLAEYGILFQLKDLDEVAAIASYDDQISMEEIRELMADDDGSDNLDFADVMLDTHYEASHDVVGIVKLHKVVNPECWKDVPEEEEYLMAEATIVELFTNKDPTKLVSTAKESTVEKAAQVDLSSTLSVARQLEERTKKQTASKVSDAVSRIKEELRAAVDEAFTKQQSQHTANTSQQPNQSDTATTSPNNQIPLIPKGILIEKRPVGSSLLKDEQSLRDSFGSLVSLQQELKETYRFTRDSVKSFGMGSVGLWLSTAAWSKFIDKRLEGTNAEMQSELQEKLLEHLSHKHDGEHDEEEQETIDFDELPSYLQNEYIEVRERAVEELGPVALQRAIQVQRILQAQSDTERLKLLKDSVDEERQRLVAKKMLRQTLPDYEGGTLRTSTQPEVRSVFGEFIYGDQVDEGNKYPSDAFQ